MSKTPIFNILAVVQNGRLAFEAVLLAASLRQSNPNFKGRLILAEPRGEKWGSQHHLPEGALKERLLELGAEIIPYEAKHFGPEYPNGNKIEALSVLPAGPFLFLDTDTIVTGDLAKVPFDFNKPAASLRREGTWPTIEPYGPGYTQTWKSLYDKFGLDFESSLDLSQPDEYWRRYLYLNAGWFFGADAPAFGERLLHYALQIRDHRPEALECQEIYPWLDQIALALCLHSFGGGRPDASLKGPDGDITCHYRTIPMLYARESDEAVALLEEIAKAKENRRILRDWPQIKKMVYLNGGRKARALFDRADLPRREQTIRSALRREGLWLR